MTKTLSLILASAAVTAALGLPAWSAMQVPSPLGQALASASEGHLLVLVDDDEGEDDDDDGAAMSRHKSDDDDDENECDDDEGSCGGAAAAAPAAAGSVPPPQNGLFDTGTPQVQVK